MKENSEFQTGFIGWDGGQPITVDNETVLSVGFSGFQGVHDLEIVVKLSKIYDKSKFQFIERLYISICTP